MALELGLVTSNGLSMHSAGEEIRQHEDLMVAAFLLYIDTPIDTFIHRLNARYTCKTCRSMLCDVFQSSLVYMNRPICSGATCAAVSAALGEQRHVETRRKITGSLVNQQAHWRVQ